MMRSFAGDEGVLARGQVDPLDHPELGQDVESPEDRGPAESEVAPTRRIEQVIRCEVALPARDETRQRAPWRGEAVAGTLERTDDGRSVDHASEPTSY
jgi:hypothetical protein